ncbi:MAG: response regulator, partial [Clostridiales bacterium]|nr:response regulator [Clostridiales bacterium]
MYSVILIDDEEISVESIRQMIPWEDYGIKAVYTAGNIEKAKLIMEETKIDIVICDIEMSGGDGFEMIRWIQEKTYPCVNIFLTCHAEFTYAQKAMRLGVIDYILKPVDPSEFSSTITGVITELDEEHKKDEDYNRQANFIKQYYMYTLLNSGDASGILDNGDFLAGYNRLALIEFNTDFFGKYDTGEDIFKEITGELDYQYLNLNPLQSVIIFSDKS